MINSVIGSPFIETYLDTRLGGGQTVKFEIQPITIDSQKVLQLNGNLVYTLLDIKYQQKIKDWMAFNGRVSVQGRLGAELGALLTEGINIGTGFNFGWLFKLYQSKDFALSGSLDVFNNSYTAVNLRKFIQGVIDSGKIVPSNKLVYEIPLLKAGSALTCAYAFNKTFGLTANFTAQYGDAATTTSESKWYINYGAVFDADLLPKQNVPIGFMLGFFHNTLLIPTDEVVTQPNNLLFQINYTGKQDLNLGLEMNYQVYKPVDFDESISIVNVALNF